MALKLINRGESTDVLLYDFIGFDTTALDFVRNLQAVTTPLINLRINSPGGYVGDGIAIYNALKAHNAKVIANIEGFCLSAATYPALAADEVVMHTGSMWMIHDVTTFAMGTSEDLRREADVSDKMQAQVVGIYANATGKSEEEIKAAMRAETWWDASEAVDYGWADRTNESQEAVNAVAAWRDFTTVPDLRNAPETIKQLNRSPSVRKVERALRAAGVSQSDAKAIATDFGNRGRHRDGAAPHANGQWDADSLRTIADALRERIRITT